MTQRILTICLTLAFIACAWPAKSEDDSLPSSMLGFLKPGMLVGIQTVEGTTSVLLDIYTAEQYEIAKDLSALGRTSVRAAKFCEDHPSVRKKLDAFVEQLTGNSPDANPARIMVFPLFRMSFGKITAVGDDYVLVRRDGKGKQRLVLARSSMARIDLDADPVRFVHTSMR